MRRLAKIAALCLLPALLSGCWSYRSLGDLAIAMGLGIDRTPEGKYRICAEVVDFTKSIKDTAPGSKLVIAEGDTVFDAVRNSKRRLLNKLYFGNIQVVAIGEELARSDGVGDIIDWFLRDGECRETVTMLVAQGEGAEKLLATKGIDQSITSLELDNVITEDHKATSSTAYVEVYQAYFMLHCPGASLALPAFHATQNGEEEAVEANGIAAFSEDKLVGFLTPGDSKFFLLATDKCKGGILPVSSDGSGRPDTSLEIHDTKAKTSFSHRGGGLSFKIEVEIDAFLAETMADIDVLDDKAIEALEKIAGDAVGKDIERVVETVQTGLRTDILGLGHKIFQRDVSLWNRLEKDWEAMFPTVPVEVSCEVSITNTAFIKSEEVLKK
ncbi:MAG: Ger(x)C family spore germination protein [Clostridiales bacterium]|nr:Ger(x)C family spore germination protein [Clostridiales bacterium]